MNVPMSWLRAYTDVEASTADYIEDITLSGSKVETVTHLGEEISKVVTGKVLSIEKHPDADKLVVTKIDIGQEEPIQIVTGATNLYVGAVVPVALNGSTLPKGIKIKTGKLRGIESQGMMCSIGELNLTINDCPEAIEDGIYIFPENDLPPLGVDVKPLFGLDDDVVEYEITSNRPDCFSITGIAREAAATYNKPFRFPKIKVEEKAGGNVNDYISVEIKNPDLCPRYTCRVVKNIKIEPSPKWMRQRLSACGVRPINNFVDITNYVMLELGQPMHAFDISTIDGNKIIVRNANEGEKITTLDGNERQLDPSMLVISDINKAVAVAGVMGGENSMINPDAKAVLFESANFSGSNVRITAKKLGMRTDASALYEKNLDPNLAEIALERAVQLVEELGAGEVVKGVVDCYPKKRDEWKVNYSAKSINALLGTDISEETMIELWNRIGVKAADGVATIPTFRPDLLLEADLAEEVARLYGYDKIETTLAAGTPTVGKKSYSQHIEDIISNTLSGMGLCEAMTYSFESPKVFNKLRVPENSDLRKAVVISNPLGEDFSMMRTIPLNGILQSLSVNYNRRNEEAMLFELSRIYIPKVLPVTELPEERDQLVIGIYGKYDFYDLKGMIEELLKVMGIYNKVKFETESELEWMHPGRTAKLTIDNVNLGYIGEIHPQVADNYEIGSKVYVAVIDMPMLIENADLERTYKPLPKFPAVTRDIAMLVKDEVVVRAIEDIIKQRGGKLVEAVNLFDVYKGKQIEEGYKSVAYSIVYRAADHTLTEEEVASSMKKILNGLERELGAKLRDK